METKDLSMMVVLVTCICIFLNGCDKDGQETRDTKQKASVAEGAILSLKPDMDIIHSDEGRANSFLPGMSCMVNEFGIRRKVLISKYGVQGTSTLGGSPESGEPLPYFRIYFLHDIYPASARTDITNANYFQIGRTGHQDNLMWIPASAATTWDHRLLYSPDNEIKTRRPPLVVYSELEAVEDIIRKGRTSYKPIARYSWRSGVAPKFMPWPILETKYIKDAEDNTIEVSKIAFLAEFRDGAELGIDEPVYQGEGSYDSYTDEQIASIQENIRMLDVVFVIDNTSSTSPFIDGIRQTVNEIASELNKGTDKTDLSLGLVLYRDYVTGLMFENNGDGTTVTQLYDLCNNINIFRDKIAPLKTPTTTSQDYPEAVYDGVNAGLTRVSWRGNKLSTRCIILIGDNSAHEPGHASNPERISCNDLIRVANKKGVRIFSLSIQGGGGNDEQQRHWEQFNALSQGTGAMCFKFNEKSVNNIVKGINEILKGESKVVYVRDKVCSEIVNGKSDEDIIREAGVSAHEFTEVMEFLKDAGVDPEMIRRNGPSFCTGWIIPKFRGESICQKQVYIARSEIRLLVSTLQELCVYCDASFGNNVMARVLGSATDGLANIFLSKGKDAGPFDLFLVKKGIPLRTGLLRFTPDELSHMSEEERSGLRRQIEKHYLPILMNAMNDDQHFQFGGVFEYGFIQADLLP